MIITFSCIVIVILLIVILHLQHIIFYVPSTPKPGLQINIINDSGENKNITVVVYDKTRDEIYNKTFNRMPLKDRAK